MTVTLNLHEYERTRVLALAQTYLSAPPTPITSLVCADSPSGPHDYFSEGDYWWRNPNDPNGPYIQRDGETNPDNFFGHRRLLIQLSVQVAALAATFKLTRDRQYSDRAAAHLRAWFVDPATRMNPHIQYAQAIKGICTGRGTGLIDTLHLAEVALATEALQDALVEYREIQNWFADYLRWFTTHPYGIAERDAQNNHATGWALQAAAFARLVGNAEISADCQRRFKEILLPDQMAADGSFPRELARTKPFGYSIFNLDVMAGICQLASTPADDLWRLETRDGCGLRRGMEFLYPFLKDKSSWRWARDVMHWEGWPVRQPALLFGALAYDEPKYLKLWKTLNSDPADAEIIRNMPIRQPVLWVR